MDNILKELQNSCEWLNSLDNNTQLLMLDFITDKTDELPLDETIIDNFDELVKNVIKVIVQKDANEEIVKGILLEYNVDKIMASAISAYCKKLSKPYIDAKLISNLEKDKLIKLCDFIINKMILFHDYEQITVDECMKNMGFSDKHLFLRALGFIRHNYIDVCDRSISLKALELKLKSEYNIPSEIVDIIITPVKTNWNELQQAHLLNKVNILLAHLSSLCSTIENEDDAK